MTTPAIPTEEQEQHSRVSNRAGEHNPNYKHGFYNKRLYRIWQNMIRRCYYPSSNRFKRYGGRGICVDKEWMDFVAFKDWAISNGYSDTLTIDRIDNDGSYCPDNCAWRTPEEQSNNTKRNRIIEIDGEKMTLQQWSNKSGIQRKTISRRLDRGWSPKNAVFERPNYDRRLYGSF